MIVSRKQFEIQGKPVLGKLIFRPPFKGSDSFKQEARLVHVVRGQSRLYAPRDQYQLTTGDTILMRCENFVNNWLEVGDEDPNEIVVMHIYEDVLAQVYGDHIPADISAKDLPEPKPVAFVPPNEIIGNFVKSLRQYTDEGAFVTEDLLKLKLQELILVLVNSDQDGQIKAQLADLFQSKDYEFKEIIHAHLFEDLKIEDLAFFAGLSLSSFKRKFKEVFDTSPNRYIRAKRLEKAQQLLKQTDLRISEIAYDCGFNDLGYFSKSFIAAFQVSPSDYRKQLLS
ncbi:MAG: AraC family transcriptional regulator [Bacteroidota bacterium]